MDFQSAARFGERRVMVTDYDETAVEVNAKVVDEDTGKVICECESGGGGGDGLIEATITNDSTSGGEITIKPVIVKAKNVSDNLYGYISSDDQNIINIEPGNSGTILTSQKGFCIPFPPNEQIVVINGNAEFIDVTIGDLAAKVLIIKGDCTLKYINK